MVYIDLLIILKHKILNFVVARAPNDAIIPEGENPLDNMSDEEVEKLLPM